VVLNPRWFLNPSIYGSTILTSCGDHAFSLTYKLRVGFFAREQLKILLWRDGGIAAESVRFVIVRNHQLVTVDNQSTLGVLLLAITLLT